MNIIWAGRPWNDYVEWQSTDPELVQKINVLIKDIGRNPFSGLGKPEPLKDNLQGFWSRRITSEHRLIYRVIGKGADKRLEIAGCRYHYPR